MHDPGTPETPARYAAAVRDFRGIVLAAIQLTERPGEHSDLNTLATATATARAAEALSADLGFAA